jgi:hypothetical protein
MGVSTTLLAGAIVYMATQIQHLDTKFTSRFDALADRLDRVIEMLAQHEHR